MISLYAGHHYFTEFITLLKAAPEQTMIKAG